MAKQPSWAQTPHRRLVAVCPDCNETEDIQLRVHFTHHNGYLHAEIRSTPVAHECDTKEQAA